MDKQSSNRRFAFPLIAAAVLVWPAAALGGGPAEKGADPLAATADRKACIDPATGRLVSPEENPACREALRSEGEGRHEQADGPSLDQSTEGLEEEPLPRGGAKVDLEGRFKKEGAAEPAAPAPTNGGLVAVIDPRTGQLMSGEGLALMRQRAAATAEMATFQRELNAALERSQDVTDLREQSLESGAVKVDLQGRFRNPLMATVTPGGGIRLHHAALDEPRDTGETQPEDR